MPCYHWPAKEEASVPVLALHGFTGVGQDFESFTDGVFPDLSWWAPNLPGHGEHSIAEELDAYTMEATAQMLDGLIEEIGQPVILLGYSMGGRLALNYVLKNPGAVRQLVLVGATPGIEDSDERQEREQKDDTQANSILKEGVAYFLKKWQKNPIIRTQESIPAAIRKPMLESRKQHQALGLANSLRGMGTGVMEPLWDRLGEIDMPVLLVTGETDSKFEAIAKRMAELLPNAVHEIIPDAGHAAHLENAHAFTSSLKKFLK